MDTHTATALSIFEAARQGDLSRVKWLIETRAHSVNETDATPSEFAALHYAAMGGHEKVIEFLLYQGAILDIESRNGGTPLTMAITNKHADITQLLLEKGADPNKRSHARFSIEGDPLHIAAAKGCTTIINQLLQHGASPNSQENFYHHTALDSAVQYLQPMSILALYPRVDTTLRNSFNHTPIEHLIHCIAEEDLEEDPSLMQCLYAFLCAGADINEELISQTVRADLLPEVIEIINNAIRFKKEMEDRLGYLGADVVQHVLLQSPKERAALIHRVEQLEALGYHQASGIRRFLLASKEEKVDFLVYQSFFRHPSLCKAPNSVERSLLDLPPELIQISLENLLPHSFDVEAIKQPIEQTNDTTYNTSRV